MMVRAEVSNPKGALVPGQFVRARLIGATYPKGILVPQRAVLQSGQGYFVWIMDKENKAQIRQIEVGPWVGDQWLVKRGLEGGEALIVDGFMRLAPGVPVKVAAAPATPSTAAQAPAVAK
jgi:membrane fusion protein (multidrug efflux system)